MSASGARNVMVDLGRRTLGRFTGIIIMSSFQSAQRAACYTAMNNLVCYPGFDTPVWTDSNKNRWNEVTHDPTTDGTQCVLNGFVTQDHPTQHYCNAGEAEDEETCEANNWYWNFSTGSC